MALHINNAEAERLARELAALTGESLTEAIRASVARRLEEERGKRRRRPTAEEMLEATLRFRRAAGLDRRSEPITKKDFDELWDFVETNRK